MCDTIVQSDINHRAYRSSCCLWVSDFSVPASGGGQGRHLDEGWVTFADQCGASRRQTSLFIQSQILVDRRDIDDRPDLCFRSDSAFTPSSIVLLCDGAFSLLRGPLQAGARNSESSGTIKTAMRRRAATGSPSRGAGGHFIWTIYRSTIQKGYKRPKHLYNGPESPSRVLPTPLFPTGLAITRA